MQICNFSIITPIFIVFSLHGPSEIILICWFDAQDKTKYMIWTHTNTFILQVTEKTIIILLFIFFSNKYCCINKTNISNIDNN